MYIEQFPKNDVFLIFLPQFRDPDLEPCLKGLISEMPLMHFLQKLAIKK